MVANLTLLQKTNFPRECFPLSQILEQTLYTAIGLIPLGILLGVHGFAPKLGSLWVPLILVVELLFTIGLTLMMAAFIVYVRDLAQVTGIILSLGPVSYTHLDVYKRQQPPPARAGRSADGPHSGPVAGRSRRGAP